MEDAERVRAVCSATPTSLDCTGDLVTGELLTSSVTSVCLAASIWPLGHPRSERHVSNLRRPDCC